MKHLRQYIKTILLESPSEIQRVFDSPVPFGEFRNVQQETSGYPRKPEGLWYSCGESWKEWIEQEGLGRRLDYKHRYEIQINKNTMYMIATLEELDAFHKRYKIRGKFGDPAIDWKAVQDDGYAGIEICPYQWKRRTAYFWYYGWDVASGCIWDKSAIKGVDKL